MSALRPLLRLAAVPPPRVAFAVLLGGLTVLFGVGLAATSGYLISRAAQHPPILALTTAIVGVRFFALGRPIVRYLERLWTHDLALRALGRVRVAAYERIEPLAPVELEDYRQGDLLSHLVADIDALQGLHLRCFDPPFVALLSGAVAVAVTAAFLPAAAVVLAVGLLVGGIGAPALALWSGRLGRGRAALQGALSAQLVELAQGAPELVAYGREDDCLAELRATDARLVRHGRRAAVLDGLGEGLLIAITGLTVTGVLAVAVAAHHSAHLDPTLIAMLTLLALASFESVQPLVQRGRELPELEAAGGRVLRLIGRRAKVADPETFVEPPHGQVSLAFEHVGLQRSAGEDAVLDDFTLRLEAGRRMALLGPSGGGKTTVTNLLLRFLDPDEGRLTLNGVDVRSYRQDDVRRTIAVAEQNGHLFSTTICENVRLARPAATDEEIWSALRTAGASDWVQSLDRGWDTVVGEQGKKLSGGQRQRLVIARALLANTPVLVLDEPTAHLDPAAAKALVTDVIAATAGRSLLLITHRTEGLELVDEVVTLERGRITA